ncbi:MAG: transposase [Methylococcales symbiont of Iophon sp. n. MRB-2018]|nr:MAG: transposase [Methylococcales symbiont of Iophon sp. n. MRB-2018]KAF3979637.1 MAG: transposase [Methylococcales symbiont of Iophon sp. n. MRB-2018]
MKNLFNDLWDIPNKKVATTFIEPWCQKVEQSKMQAFMAFVKTVKSYLSGIVNFVENRYY